jgi:murein DD-endopeptidase MepM/ murein hydrolase activator NlpD
MVITVIVRKLLFYWCLIVLVHTVQAHKIVLLPPNPRLGEPVTVGVRIEGAIPQTVRAVLINASGQRFMAANLFDLGPAPGIKAAVLSVPSTAKPGPAKLVIEAGGQVIGEMPFTIVDRVFVSEEIALDERNTDIRTTPDPQKAFESTILWTIISRTGTEIYTTEKFILPVVTPRRTSFFGDRRVYRYSNGSYDTAIHAGVDYGVPTGTPIKACARGKVALAVFRIATGNSVIIEHFPGVYSLYYHLSTIAVLAGDIVEAGAIIGESGATGLATGPHLHWEIRVATENSDPDAFVARSVLDKAVLFDKLK